MSPRDLERGEPEGGAGVQGDPAHPWPRLLLARLLPPDAWSREFLAAHDAELAQHEANGDVPNPTRWWMRRLSSPATLRFVWLMRRRARHGGPVRAGNASGRDPDPTTRPPRADLMDDLTSDLRHALRSLSREPRVALVIVLMLGAGVGAVTAIQGVSERLFLGGPPHVEDPDALVRFYIERLDATGTRTAPYIPYATARAIRENAPGLERTSLYVLGSALGRVGEGVETLQVAEVDGAYFTLLGVRPLAGRFPGDDPDDLAARPAVISSALALRSFGGAEGALGRTLELPGGSSHTIVGVAPDGFSGPHLGRIDAWLPMNVERAGNRNWWMIARLPTPPDAAALERLAAEANAVHGRTDPGSFYQWAREGRIAVAGVGHDDAGRAPPEETSSTPCSPCWEGTSASCLGERGCARAGMRCLTGVCC